MVGDDIVPRMTSHLSSTKHYPSLLHKQIKQFHLHRCLHVLMLLPLKIILPTSRMPCPCMLVSALGMHEWRNTTLIHEIEYEKQKQNTHASE